MDGKLVRGGNRADQLEHAFRFFLRGGSTCTGISGGGCDFVRDVLNHAGYVVRGVEAQGGGGFDRDVHKHVGTAFAHGAGGAPGREGAASARACSSASECSLPPPSSSMVTARRESLKPTTTTMPEANSGGDGVRHMQNAPERAVRRKVFAGLHAKQADEHDSGGPDVRGEMQGVGFQRLAFVLLGDAAEHGGPVDVHKQGNEGRRSRPTMTG